VSVSVITFMTTCQYSRLPVISVCPYYTSKELKKEADIIFMPYNYLIDPKVTLHFCQQFCVYVKSVLFHICKIYCKIHAASIVYIEIFCCVYVFQVICADLNNSLAVCVLYGHCQFNYCFYLISRMCVIGGIVVKCNEI